MDSITRWQSAFILAVILSLFLTNIPPLLLLILAFILSICTLIAGFFTISGLLAGISCFFLHAYWITAWQLPEHLIKQPLTVVGHVTDLGIYQQGSHRFILELHDIKGVNLPRFTAVKIKLLWRDQMADFPTPKQGQRLQLTVKLKPAHGFANLGGFSYSKWLLLQGIRATGYVDSKSPVHLLDKNTHYRYKIYRKLFAATTDFSHQGLIIALGMGERQHIAPAQRQLIHATGIGHLLAISGLHIGMMFVLTRFVGFWLASCLHLCIKLPCNSHTFGMCFGLLGALIYSWLAGFSLTTIRALMMLSLAILFIYAQRGINKISIVFTTLTAILIFDGVAILSPSLWLSFAAVIGILLLLWWWPNQPKKCSGLGSFQHYLVGLIKIQLMLFIVLLPLTAMIFNGTSMSGSWVNLLAVPWVSLITVPLTVVGTLLLILGVEQTLLLNLADHSLTLLLMFIALPWNQSGWLDIGFLPWYGWLFFLGTFVIWMLPIAKIHQGIAMLCWVFPLSWQWQKIADNPDLLVHVLDVGQGLAVVVERNRRILVYDLGPIYPSGFNAVSQVLQPYFAYRGITHIDWLIISHSDSDHAGAYPIFVDQFTVGKIIAPTELGLAAASCQPRTLSWQGTKLEFLWPPQASMSAALPPKKSIKYNRNDQSCVLKISHQYGSLLLPGDISSKIERQLVTRYKTQLQADLLIAPHHGSLSSSSDQFISTVNPKYVTFSSGFYNRYHMPTKKMVTRYQNHQVNMHNTAQVGQISYRFSADGIQVTTARQDLLPQWYFNL